MRWASAGGTILKGKHSVFARRKDRLFNRTIRLVSIVCVLAFALAWPLIHRGGVTPTIVAAFLVLPFAYLVRDGSRRSALLDALSALAVLLVAVGYAGGLFWWVAPYDAWAHLLATLSVSLAFFFALYHDAAMPQQRIIASAASVFALGILVGVLWEVVESAAIGNEKSGSWETMGDLGMNCIGALAAAVVVVLIAYRHGDRLA